MKNRLKIVSFVLILLISNSLSAQNFDGLNRKGSTIYREYDKSHVSPLLRGKHGVSLGFYIGLNSPVNDFIPNPAYHIGYNYLVFKKRKRIMGHKEKYRDEVKFGFGAHLQIEPNHGTYFMLNYYNSFFSLKGRILSWYFINEFGIGIYKGNHIKEEYQDKLTGNASLELLRIRFGKSPLVLHSTLNFNLKNNMFSEEKAQLGIMFGVRYYFYKIK